VAGPGVFVGLRLMRVELFDAPPAQRILQAWVDVGGKGDGPGGLSGQGMPEGDVAQEIGVAPQARPSS